MGERDSGSTFYESLPTSSAGAAAFSGLESTGLYIGLLFLDASSAQESAVLRLFSPGEEIEDVLRLRLAPGTYLSIERFLGRLGLGLLRRSALLDLALRSLL